MDELNISQVARADAVAAFLSECDSILVVETDVEGRVRDCNPAVKHFLGPALSPIGMSIGDLFEFPQGILEETLQQEVSPVRRILVRIKGCARVARVNLWRIPHGLLLIAEQMGAAEDSMLRAMTAVNNELVTLTRDLARKNRELQEANQRIELLSRTDPLTGLANRRYLKERADQAISLARRHGQPLCLVMADLDHFKRINDTFGHEAGDRVLVHFADLLKRTCRKEDLPARLGGEEFAVLLPMTPEEGALQFGNRVREELRKARILDREEPVTTSMGLALLGPGEDLDALLRRADKALYVAKQEGRDRVVTASSLAHGE